MLEFFTSKIASATLHIQRRALVMPGGGYTQIKTSEEPSAMRGESIDFFVFDESAHIPQLQEIWEQAVRPCLLDRKGSAWFFSTPKGFNYFHDPLFLRGKAGDANWASFQFPSSTNPFLDTDELEAIGRDMPALVRRQEIEAEFVQLAGALFKRDNVKVIEIEPPAVRWCRSWDLAASAKTTADFTVGAKIGVTADGLVVVSDIRRGRWEWPEAVRRISETAKSDGVEVRQGVETVGTQAGMLQMLMADPQLVGYSFEPVKVSSDKVSRALPLVSRAEQGKLAVLRAPWNKDFLDELAAFPESKNDDQIDAVAGGFTMLSSPSGAITDASKIWLGRQDGFSTILGFAPRVYTSPRSAVFDNRAV